MTNKFVDHLISLLGKSNTDEKLVEFFIENLFVKSKEEIKLPIYDEDGDLLDEYNFYISKYDDGLGFIFTDESFYFNQEDKPITGEKIYLTTIFFYNDGVEGFSQYKQGLPFNLKLSMNRAEIENILGVPLFTKDDDGVVRSQKWKIKGVPFTIYVSYTNRGEIRYISLSIPY